jgi:methylated-DNA-protein-cysteine methyltransferase-like protein
MPKIREPGNFYEAVYRLVRKIPRGRVMTYGQIATILGAPRAARAVGYALRACDGHDVPWQRVINAQGTISARGRAEAAMLQREMLEDEGVVFNEEDACDLRRYRWDPKRPEQFFYGPSANAPF